MSGSGMCFIGIRVLNVGSTAKALGARVSSTMTLGAPRSAVPMTSTGTVTAAQSTCGWLSARRMGAAVITLLVETRTFLKPQMARN